LGEHVKLPAAARQLHVDVSEQLQRGRQPGGAAPHTLGDRGHLAVLGGQQRVDAVGFTVVQLAEDDRALAVGRHPWPSGLSIKGSPVWPSRRTGFMPALTRASSGQGWSAFRRTRPMRCPSMSSTVHLIPLASKVAPRSGMPMVAYT